MFITSCASPARYNCNYEYCGQDEWQNAINRIYLANFPEDEPYEGVLWKDDFMNAWVSTGNKINITALMLYELGTPERRAAVVAHEMAHLKQGHYYTKLGTAILANALIIAGEAYMPYSSYVTNPLGSIGLAAFSRSHESEEARHSHQESLRDLRNKRNIMYKARASLAMARRSCARLRESGSDDKLAKTRSRKG